MLDGALLESLIPITKAVIPEIKPKKPGLLAEKNQPTPEQIKNPKTKYLVVLGQGPVLNEETMEKPSPGSKDIKETSISWMKTIARAAGELKLAGEIGKIILTGGKTGGEDYHGLDKKAENEKRLSEAELMKKILIEEYGISEDDIIVEDKATNSLQNFAYSLNKIDSLENPGSKANIGFLGADFHLARIRMLAKLFGLNNETAFSAEQVFKKIAQDTEDLDLLNLINLRLNPNEDLSAPNSRINWNDIDNTPRSAMKAPSYFEKQKGMEGKGISEKMKDENWYTYGLLEKPTYWIGYIGFLDNNDRLMKLLKSINEIQPDIFHQMDINLEKDEINKIREKLLEYTKEKRANLNDFKSTRTDWPEGSRTKLSLLANKKQDKKGQP